MNTCLNLKSKFEKEEIQINNKGKGVLGETVAKEYLIEKGYTIVAENYRCARGEIDLIATCCENKIIFIEVKARAGDKYGMPCQAVSIAKLQRITSTARSFLQKNKKYLDFECRVDVIEVYFEDNFAIVERINHIENVSMQ